MKIDKRCLESEWVEYEDIKLLIKPLSTRLNPYLLNGNVKIGEYYWEVFNQCVIDWEGIVDVEDKPIKCNTTNKDLVYNSKGGMDLAIFVGNKQEELRSRFDGDIKN